MNKATNRYDRTDHISRIQANLKEMKEEVTEYLRKSNNQTVPPVLRARHYLIISCINKINNKSNDNQRENIKKFKDLSSQKLVNTNDSDRLQTLRQSTIDKSEKNKIIKQKRTLLRFQNKSNIGDSDCLLPNICQVKLDLQDKTAKMPRRNMLESKINDKSTQQNQYTSVMKEHRYRSIDFNRKVHIQDYIQNSPQKNKFKVTNRSLSKSKSKQSINNIQKKHSLSEFIYQNQLIRQKNSIAASQIVDLSKQKYSKDQIQTPKIVYQQRKQAILKRRAEAVLNFAKSKSKKRNIYVNHQKKSMKKTIELGNESIHSQFHNDNKSEWSPWEEGDFSVQRSLIERQLF